MLLTCLLAGAAVLVLPVLLRFAEGDHPDNTIVHEDDPPDTAGLLRDQTVILAAA